MRALREFVKSTLVGGLLVVVPIHFSVATASRPGGLLFVAVLCFATGLLLRTRLGHRVRSFERRVFEKIPGFGVLRGAVRRRPLRRARAVGGVSDGDRTRDLQGHNLAL